jgi:hypothetical protein
LKVFDEDKKLISKSSYSFSRPNIAQQATTITVKYGYHEASWNHVDILTRKFAILSIENVFSKSGLESF